MGNIKISEHITPEQRLAALEKARAARAMRTKADVRDDFADMGLWEEMAREQQIRLPQSGRAITTGRIAKWLRTLGIKTKDLLKWDGSKNLHEFAGRNPSWSIRAMCGLILEHRELMIRMRDWK